MVCVPTMLIGARGCAATQHDSLPSWNDGPAKSAITDFVGGVTTEGSPDVVRAAPEMEMVIRKSPLALTQHVPTQVENPSTGGGMIDFTPTAVNPSQDYVSVKGVTLEDDDNTRLEKDADGDIVAVANNETTKLRSPIPLIIALG